MSQYTVPIPVNFKFGSFDYFCNQIALTMCPLVGGQNGNGMEPACYSRNIGKK